MLFRETATRRVGDEGSDEPTEVERWWEDVDSLGNSIDDMMPMWWDLAATFGHCALYFEAPEVEVMTAADQVQPRVRAYTPLDIINWLTDERGQIIAVKLAEAIPFNEFTETSGVYKHSARSVIRNMSSMSGIFANRLSIFPSSSTTFSIYRGSRRA